MLNISQIAACAAAFTLAFAGEALASGDMRVPDALTQSLLRRAEFERIEISPDGERLAIARHGETGTTVTLYRRRDMAPLTTLDPGKDGEITDLEWLDDERLLVGAVRDDATFGVPMIDPALYIIRADGSDRFMLPANFFATIDGDPDHLLVTSCGHWDDGYCIDEIRKAEIGKLRRVGELVIAAPDAHATMIPDHKGNVRFAISWQDDESAKTYLHTTGTNGWKLINDSTKTGIYLLPIGVSADGKTGFVVADDSKGTSTVERFDFATEARTPVYSDPASQPLTFLRAINGSEPIGAVYQATHPRIKFWNTENPDSQLMTDIAAAFPDAMAYVYSASADKTKLILNVSNDHDPGRFYFLDRTTRKATLLAAERPWLDPAKLARQRPFALKARDGTALEGLLTLPPSSDPRHLPMVVLPHGGPYGIYDGWGFNSQAQILATHGYAVLQVNFRGSGGYGAKFVEAGFRQWGRAMQDDVTDATRWAIGEGIADPARICIFGGSYGGYAALMGVIREPALYRCAVGSAGVYDLGKLYKWGSLHRSDLGKRYLEEVLGTDAKELEANSPAMLADRIQVPVLLAHGRLDARVDIKHARLMKKMMSKRDKQVELIEYPYEGHGLALDEHRQDFYARLLDFLATNLRQPMSATVAPTAAAPPSAH